VDIKKEFEPCLSTPSVRILFEILREEEAFFAFDNIEQFLMTMRKRTLEDFPTQDACLGIIISHIQLNLHAEAGVKLLTYLLAPGLQAILKRLIHSRVELREAWSDLWWRFYQTVMGYPLIRRPHKVAANLIRDTEHKAFQSQRAEVDRLLRQEPLDNQELASEPSFVNPLFIKANRLIDGEEVTGFGEVDIAIVIGTRVYDEDMHDVADRLGISYEAARKRRQRTEKKIRQDWLDES